MEKKHGSPQFNHALSTTRPQLQCASLNMSTAAVRLGDASCCRSTGVNSGPTVPSSFCCGLAKGCVERPHKCVSGLEASFRTSKLV